MRTLDQILIEWVSEFGVLARGSSGPYRYIKYDQKKDLLMILVQTLIDEGYSEDTLKSSMTANAIISACEAPDGASSRPSSKIKKSKQITSDQLKFVLGEYFRGKFSAPKLESNNNTINTGPETTFKAEKKPEINPSDRLKMDTSDISNPEYDLDFANELGLDLKAFNGESNG